MDKRDLVFKVAGAAGEGIMATGLLFSKTCARHGFFIFDYSEYPSLITGGHNTYQVHFSQKPVYCQSPKTDILLALNTDSLKMHIEELSQDSIVIYDNELIKNPIEEFNLPAKILTLPMKRLAEEAGGKELMANIVGLGAAAYLSGFSFETVNAIVAEVFADKDAKIIETDQKAAFSGYNHAKSQIQSQLLVEKTQGVGLQTMTGNEAVALGAIAGGLQFYAGYPMTPSSTILHYMAKNAKTAGIVVKQAEDEISVISMAIGASFAGVRAMVGSSGGGFSLMVESLGLAGITELPLVVFEGTRPGPALGLPTWTDQGDLRFVIHAGNGEFPRIVLAPSDAQEAFELSRKAQILAETFQTPVIILSDKYLAESRYCVNISKEVFTNSRFGIEYSPKPDQTGFFPRYRPDLPISPRTIPGTPGGTYIANADDHDQYGFSAEEAEVRSAQVNKRNKKFDLVRLEIPKQYLEEEPQANLTFISFGSTKGAIKEARDSLTLEGIKTNHLNLSWIWPFPKVQVEEVIQKSKNVVVVEGNSHRQLAGLIAQETGFIAKYNLNKYDGRPFFAKDIENYVKNIKE